MMLYGGHKYVIAHKKKNQIVWRCNSSKLNCKAGAITCGQNVTLLQQHNHSQENFPIKVLKTKK
jgi:hypothetical protein